MIFVDTTTEPSTADIDSYRDFLVEVGKGSPSTIIGVGGASTLDSAKLWQIYSTNVEKLRIIRVGFVKNLHI